jgi:hypothetical protein
MEGVLYIVTSLSIARDDACPDESGTCVRNEEINGRKSSCSCRLFNDCQLSTRGVLLTDWLRFDPSPGKLDHVLNPDLRAVSP